MRLETVYSALIAALVVTSSPLRGQRNDFHNAATDFNAKYALETIKSALAKKQDINARDASGETPLCLAMNQPVAHEEVVAALLANGAICTPKGSDTLLHVAARQRLPAVTETLIAKGANVNARGENGRTPLHYVSYQNNSALSRNSWDVPELLNLG